MANKVFIIIINKLKYIKKETKHLFRRTLVTGVDILALNSYGRQKSKTIAKNYVAKLLLIKTKKSTKNLEEVSCCISTSTFAEKVPLEKISCGVSTSTLAQHYSENDVELIQKRKNTFRNFVRNVKNGSNCTIITSINKKIKNLHCMRLM